MKLFGVIYKHYNKANGKVYIGQTIQVDNLDRRFRKQDSTHHSYKSCPAFFNALNKHSWAQFDTEILYSAFDQEALNKAEEYFINFYNSLVPNGYNTSMMVDGSVKFTPEIKAKLSASRKAYYNSLGIIPEAVNKKKHIMINEVPHKECARCLKIKSVSEFGKYAKKWDGLNGYCKKCNSSYRRYYKQEKLSPEQLKESYKNRREAVSAGVKKSFQEKPSLRINKAKQKSKPIKAINIRTGEELTFSSALEAKRFGFDNANISSAIRKNKPYKGFTWSFIM